MEESNKENTQSTQRILVTGASGFIGKAVLDELSQRGIETHALGRNPPAVEKRTGITWHQTDLLDANLGLSKIISDIKPTHCLHLGWEATPGYYRNAKENYDWAAATLRLAHAFFEAGGKSFTMAGSCIEYALPTEFCDELTTSFAGDCAYAICKTATAQKLSALALEFNAKFSSGRIFYVYGPEEPAAKLVASLCRGLVNGQEIPLTSGEDVVDYIFRSDVVNAIIALAFSPVSGYVNIGSGQPALVHDIAEKLGKIAGKPQLLQFGKVAMTRDPVRIVAATDRLRNEVGYQPVISLDQGLRACYEYWKNNT